MEKPRADSELVGRYDGLVHGACHGPAERWDGGGHDGGGRVRLLVKDVHARAQTATSVIIVW